MPCPGPRLGNGSISKAGGKAGKAGRRKAATLKRLGLSKAAPKRRSTATSPETDVVRLTRERDEALEREKATADVLRVISSSPGELEPVFQAMLENATRICKAKFGVMFYYRNGALHPAAQINVPIAFSEFIQRRGSYQPSAGSTFEHLIRTKQAVHLTDAAAEGPYFSNNAARLGGARTYVAVPMLKESELVGALAIYRHEVRPFTDKQIELLTNFAAQAVIAIENTRLLNELRQRTTDLTELLEQQTATSEVLQVISSSPGDLEPVFARMLENAVRICNATFGNIYRWDGDLHIRASHKTPAAFAEARREVRQSFKVDERDPLGRMILSKRAVHVGDLSAEQVYLDRSSPGAVMGVELGGIRTTLMVPLLKDDEVIGAFVLSRHQVQPFTDKQIALVQNFAAQAVIAIENTRLLNELRQRTEDLSEVLEQQTGTSNVLRVISSSPGELEPVFTAMLENATRICDASYGVLFRVENGTVSAAAMLGLPPAFAEFWRGGPRRPGPGTALARVIETKGTVHITDVKADPAYIGGESVFVAAATLGGFRTLVNVPMLKKGEIIGVFAVYRQEVRPFTDKQIDLLKNFAAQAVIAIENTRLLSELRQRTDELGRSVEELGALGETSQAVNSTLDLQTVLSTIVARAVQLSGTKAGAIYVFDEGPREFRLRATHGMDQELIDALDQQHIRLDEANLLPGDAIGEPVQVADLRAEAHTELGDIILRAGYRARLIAPLVRGDETVGLLVVRRKTPGAFPQNTVDLMKTFAAQSALAIQNARLFYEIEQKSRQLQEASQHKSQFLANMSHELRTPLNAILGYTELMADGAYGEPTERMMGVLKRLESNGKHLLGLINDVLDLSKIEAGQLVLDLADYSLQDVAQTVHSAVEPLAADKKLKFTTELMPDLPRGRGDERRLTQVLLNLVGNAIKFTDDGEVAIKVSVANGAFNVAVQDTGPGITTADQAKLFQEFQQADNSVTKKKGGTGLGLAISKRIIEMHGGRIWVDSTVGQGSTFAFTLPVHVAQQVEPA